MTWRTRLLAVAAAVAVAVVGVRGLALEPYRVDGLCVGPVTEPQGAVFALGDSRAGSIDSRVYGAVPLT